MSAGFPRDNECRLPSEAYHRTLLDAQAARARFLGRALSSAAKTLKGRMCNLAYKWNIRLCPLCC